LDWSQRNGVTGGPVAPHSPCTGTLPSLEWTESPRSKASGSASADAAADGQTLLGTAPGARGGTQGGFADGGMPAQGSPGNFAPDGLGGMGSGVSAAVHSEYVVLQDGAYITKFERQGTVTEVSSDSVTV